MYKSLFSYANFSFVETISINNYLVYFFIGKRSLENCHPFEKDIRREDFSLKFNFDLLPG